eukprot:774043-Amphidinium_carterae.1
MFSQRMRMALRSIWLNKLKFSKWEYMSFQYCGKDLTFIDGDDLQIGQEVIQEDISAATVSKH